jgi:hypothetical protein
MTDSIQTTFDNKCEILGELWITYKNDPEFTDFLEYNDLGLPLAYAIAGDIVKTTPKSTMFIEETFDLLLTALEIQDEGFDSLDDLFLLRNG